MVEYSDLKNQKGSNIFITPVIWLKLVKTKTKTKNPYILADTTFVGFKASTLPQQGTQSLR